jgi:hypothetical protein
MKYFKVFLLWLLFIVVTTYYGDYVVSREVNGFIQLLSFVGMVGLLGFVGNETIKVFRNNKKEEK